MLDENAIVEKSKKLIWSKYSKWNAGELAVFDTYLSRINARDPSTAEVVFTKREYEELMGLKEVRPDQLNRYVRNFIGNVVSIKTDRGWRNYPLFHKANFEKNDAGEWEVTLRCNPELQDAFFSLAESGYQAYRLKYTIAMKSKYSKLLYGLLKDNLYRGTWQIDLKELRELLGATEASWESFKEFNRRILKVGQKEISECSDIEFEYDKIAKGRLTKAVCFKIKKKPFVDDIIDMPQEGHSETSDGLSAQRDKAIVDEFRETMSYVKNWIVSDEEILFISKKIHDHILAASIIHNLTPHEISVAKLQFLEDLFYKARAERVNSLYGFLFGSDPQWERYKNEIELKPW